MSSSCQSVCLPASVCLSLSGKETDKRNVLTQACSKHKEHKVVDMVTMVLRVFVDTYPHIPEHRKLMVFTTLLRVVGVESYLWRLLLVFIEGVAARSKTGASVAVGSESASAVEEQDGKVGFFFGCFVLFFAPLRFHCFCSWPDCVFFCLSV